MISNRHIRHDWQTFVNWEQNSVKTVCGQKSTPRLCGIPGLTEQPMIVNGRPGWCPRCIHLLIKGGRTNGWKSLLTTMGEARRWAEDSRISALYDTAGSAVADISQAINSL